MTLAVTLHSLRRSISALIESRSAASAGITCDTNTILRPSGIHAGFEAPSGMSVSRTASPPSVRITWSWERSPPRFAVKAIQFPSGLHAGEPSLDSHVVKRLAPEPSVATSQISLRPSFSSRSYSVTVTAAHAPSGESSSEPTLFISQRSSGVMGWRPAAAAAVRTRTSRKIPGTLNLVFNLSSFGLDDGPAPGAKGASRGRTRIAAG